MQRWSRREFLGMLGAAAAAPMLGRTALGEDSAPKRPNILFIMSDDHDARAMSCYGAGINQTPNIDRIAKEGMRFANCFCTNSLCGPSRAVILTAKYSHLNGYKANEGKFDGSQQTLPKLMQKAGYQTAIVGKWHLGSDPTGFDYWNILPGQGVYYNPMFIEMGQRKKHQGYVTDLIADFTLAWLRGRDKSRPFFLMCHNKAPHRPWEPDDKHAAMFEQGEIPEPETFDDDYKNRASAAAEATMRVGRDLTKTDVKADPPPGLSGEALKKWKYQRFIKDYLRCVASVDDNVGRLLDYLDKEGLAQDTIVIYTSDQGFYLGEHGWFDKRFMYETSMHMPFVIRYPREIKAGSVCSDMMINLDFAETFLDYAGAPAPADMQGRSARPLMQGKTPGDWRTSCYYHYYEYPAPHRVQPHYGVRTKRYKLIHYYRTGEWELFDLEKDHWELKSVYDDPAYAETVKELKAELARLRKELKEPENEPGPAPAKTVKG